MSYISVLYQIVICPKYRIHAINEEHEMELYRYMYKIARSKKCKVYIINGMPDHIHMLVSISPEIAISTFMMVLKSETSKWIKKSGLFPRFIGWSKRYAIFSYSHSLRNVIYRYIANQKSHHRKKSFRSEIDEALRKHGFDPSRDNFMQEDD